MNVNSIQYNTYIPPQRPPMIRYNTTDSSASLTEIELNSVPDSSFEKPHPSPFEGMNIRDILFTTHNEQIDMSMRLMQTITENKTPDSIRIGFTLEELEAAYEQISKTLQSNSENSMHMRTLNAAFNDLAMFFNIPDADKKGPAGQLPSQPQLVSPNWINPHFVNVDIRV